MRNTMQTSPGRKPVKEYLEELAARKDKNSRIKLNKIRDYIKILSEYGTRAGEPYTKHIEGDIWELHPLQDCILFVAWINNSFVLLHQFVEKTPKTPEREKAQARREYADMIERGIEYEQK